MTKTFTQLARDLEFVALKLGQLRFAGTDQNPSGIRDLLWSAQMEVRDRADEEKRQALQHIETSDVETFLLGVEFGVKRHEQGDNLQAALIRGRSLYNTFPREDRIKQPKRPKDMTPDERKAIPVKDDKAAYSFSPYGLRGDDLIGYWQDVNGKWWREPEGGFI